MSNIHLWVYKYNVCSKKDKEKQLNSSILNCSWGLWQGISENVSSKQLWAAQNQNWVSPERNGVFKKIARVYAQAARYMCIQYLALAFFFLLIIGVKPRVSYICSALIHFQFLCLCWTHIQVWESNELDFLMESSKSMTGFPTISGIKIALLVGCYSMLNLNAQSLIKALKV